MHDLFHVLSGYGTDEMGESALLGFSFAQQGGRLWGFLGVATALQACREVGPSWLPYLYRAWRRGHRAAWLPAFPFEDLLPLPLATVRDIAGIEDESLSHPRGILRGTWSDAA